MNALRTNLQTLSKLLGMLGSNHDGEALSAARKAHELVKRCGATWPEVLQLAETPNNGAQAVHRDEAQHLLHVGKGIITDFERRFLVGIIAFETLSEKQETTLAGIRAKIHSGEGR